MNYGACSVGLQRLVRFLIIMTKTELIKTLEDMDDDKVCILHHPDGGWSNIEEVTEDASTIKLTMADHPLSDRD